MYVDFEYWAKKYEEKHYAKNIRIEYIDHSGNVAEEKSPCFELISKVLQKRGYLFREDFIGICKWKSKRPIRWYKGISKEEIERVTKTVISIYPNTKEQISELINLKGVRVPIASAILTVIFPENYCVLDYRAWRALYWVTSSSIKFTDYSALSNFLDDFRNYASKESYIPYLESMKTLAKHHKMIPRRIEMALWEYDVNRGLKNE